MGEGCPSQLLKNKARYGQAGEPVRPQQDTSQLPPNFLLAKIERYLNHSNTQEASSELQKKRLCYPTWDGETKARSEWVGRKVTRFCFLVFFFLVLGIQQASPPPLGKLKSNASSGSQNSSDPLAQVTHPRWPTFFRWVVTARNWPPFTEGPKVPLNSPGGPNSRDWRLDKLLSLTVDNSCENGNRGGLCSLPN